MPLSLLYITAANAEEATRIARTLVEERLVACANVLGAATSFYRWNGALQEEREVPLIAKTADARVEAVIARVKELHSYTCPCVVAMPIAGGNPDFLQWLESESAGS